MRDAEPPSAAGFSEREFYRREFRGRTLALALPADGGTALRLARPVLDELAAGGARALLLSAEADALEAALPGAVVPAEHARLEGEVWRRLRAGPRLAVRVGRGAPFAATCRDLALRLGVPKLVFVDPGGGLRDTGGHRLSFVHLDELRALLRDGGAGLAGGERVALWREVEAMLAAGLPAVNVCSADGLDDELFTYAGSGTLFTRERYMTVRRLCIDDYDAAWDLIARGVDEGFLAPRDAEQVDAVLANGFGAFVEGSHLAGIGALLPGGDGRSGEIACLYTLTRFLGEGVGVALVAHALARAAELGYGYVFACTTSERVGAFFERNGLAAVALEQVPDAKWQGYDAERRARVRCYRRELAAPPDG
jgi:amino-acid N-acetyltransferase